MKKQTVYTGVKVMMAAVTVLVSFLPAYQTLAWGPERETYHWDTAAPHRTMNSIIDNPAVGDERNFVRVRKVGDEKVKDEVALEVGQEYEVQIYFHNNASESLNASGAGIADNVRMNTILPGFVAKGTTAEISGTITAGNTTPKSVWDEAYVTSTSDVYLRYVPDSAIIHSNGSINGMNVGPDYLFSAEGALIGYSKNHWGVLPGCNQYAGFVSYKFVVDQPGFEIAKEVRLDGKGDWSESLSAKPGEVLEFRIRYKNTGTTEQNNVLVNDSLPDALVHVPNTTLLVNGSTPGGVYVSDNLFDTGLNIGRYQSGSEATLTYKVQMPSEEVLECGNNVFTNAVSVATGNGTMDDDVEITVVRECVVTELPITGPEDVVLATVAVLAVGVGGMYWYRSRRLLKIAERAAREGVDRSGEI